MLFYSSSLFALIPEKGGENKHAITDISAKLELSRQLSEKDPQQAISIASESLNVAKKKHHLLLEAEARHTLVIAKSKLGQYASAIDEITLAAKIFSDHGYDSKEASTYNTLGLIHSAQGKYSSSLEFHIKALTIRRKINDIQGIAISYNNLGNSYRNSGDLEKSLEFLYQAIAFKKSLNNPTSLAFSYNNIGHTFRRMQDYENAHKYYALGLEIRTIEGQKSGIASSLNNIGTLLQLEGKFELALNNFKQSLAMRKQIGNKIYQVGSLNNIGSVLSQMGRNDEALSTLFLALELSKSIDSPVILVETLLFLSNIYERMGQFENALKFHKEYTDENTKQFNATNSARLMTIQTDFGTKEKELHITHLEALALAKKISRDKENILYLISAVLFLFIFLLLIHRYIFTKRTRNQYQDLYADLTTKTNQLAQVNKSLAVLSSTDSLTGLYNRRKFDDQLNQQLRSATRNKDPLSLLIIDIDNFKAFNDTFGHQAGDECLKRVTKVFKSVVHRAEDSVCRYGGEEFAIILANTSSVGIPAIAEQIRVSVENENIPVAPTSLYSVLTVSIGVHTMLPEKIIRAEQMIAKADEALYRAKKQGKNCVVHSSEMT